ncbi:MAG: glutathione S-transferase family protein [Alphaproteobacteria bacterium]|nr:glutathione S-transferase family protein [Alphaproteobacteria bacterium]
MKLRFAEASPYARKVRLLIREAGLTAKVDEIELHTSPVSTADVLWTENPTGRIPVLILDDGSSLYDSRVITQYLDSLHNGPALYPAGGDDRWTVMRREAIAEGLLDSAVNTRYEMALRPEGLRWTEWIEAQLGKIRKALDAMESEVDGLGERVTMAQLSFATALGYLDFRFADLGWRPSHPKLAAWFDAFAKRPAMLETRPPA